MKKFYTLVAACLFAIAVNAQSERLVLVEHFSGASCPPCASFNPGVQAILDGNTDKVTSIKYQLAPPGTDPMYSHNPAHSGARFSYYPGTGIPKTAIDGNHFNGHPADWNVNTINNRQAVPSPFDIDVEYSVSPTTVSVEVTVTASQEFTDANLRLHTVVIEELIEFDEPAGSNGETSFKHVMKQMLPNQNGTTIQNEWQSGESQTFEFSWAHANVYNLGELAMVVFIQNNTSREVHQAAFNNTPTYESDFNYALTAEALAGIPEQVCDATFGLAPSFQVTNFGAENITELDIVVTVNGEQFPFTWEGNLGLFENTIVSVPEITVESPLATNEVSISIESINGNPNEMEDVLMVSNFATRSISVDANISITFDCWPDETSWSLSKTSDNSLVASGSNYGAAQAGQTINVPVQLENGECYRFSLEDDYGDGMNGSQWAGCSLDGSVTISDNFGTIAWEYDGSYEFSLVEAEFSAVGFLSAEEEQQLNGLDLFPNPTKGILNIEFNLRSAQNTQIDVFDVTGKHVISHGLGMIGEGFHRHSIDLSSLQQGLYVINFTTDQGTQAHKVMLTH